MLALITAIHNQIHFPHCFVNRYKHIPIHRFSLPTVFTCAVVLGDGRGWKGRIKHPPQNSQDFPHPSSFLLQRITREGVVQNLCEFCLRMWQGQASKPGKEESSRWLQRGLGIADRPNTFCLPELRPLGRQMPSGIQVHDSS